MRHLNKTLLPLFVILLFTGYLPAQENIIGYVVDEQGHPLLGATVMVVNSENRLITGNTTDFFGEFSQDIAETNKLIVSYMGFKQAELSYEDIVNNNWVVLQENQFTLDQVVVSLTMHRNRRSCDSSIAEITSGNVRLEEKINFQPLSFYPNPTHDFVRVTLQSESKGTIEIINANGAILDEVSFVGKNVDIDLAAYPNGSYFLRHISGEDVYVMGKVLKIDR